MKFTISTHDLRAFKSLLWYANNRCSNNNTHHFFIGECVYHDEDDNDLVDFIGFDKEFTFNHKDKEIKIIRIRSGDPVFINSRAESGYYEEILMEILSDVSDEDKIKFMKELVLDVKEAYKDNKKLKNKADTIFLYSYNDGYWEDIKKIKKRKLDTVILDKETKDEVQKCMDNFNNKDLKQRLGDLGINHKMNLIFSGLPGTGKSSLMYSIASHLNKDISTIDFNSVKLSDHSFICATNKIPEGSIFCLEDVDSLWTDRVKKEENRVSFSCILNFLDGVYSKGDLITIITTNHIERLDKALIRPMRIDNIINFTYCSKFQYSEIFKLFFPDTDISVTNDLYKQIKHKKYTTSMLQKFFIRFIYEPEKLIDNIKMFEELITMSSEKESNMFL